MDILLPLKSRTFIFVLFVCLFAAFVADVYVEREQASIVRRSQVLAHDISEKIVSTQKTIIDDTRLYLKELAKAAEVQTPSDPRCSEYLAKKLESSRLFVNIGVPSADGQLLCNALPLPRAVNVFDREYFQRSLQGREFSVGEFQQDRAAQLTSVNFSYPVVAPSSGKVVGVAVAVVSLAWWNDRLREFRLPLNSVAIISDSQGKVVANYPNDDEALGVSRTNYGLSDEGIKQGAESVVGVDSIVRTFVHAVLYKTPDGRAITVSVGIPFDQSISVYFRWVLYMSPVVFVLLLVIANAAGRVLFD